MDRYSEIFILFDSIQFQQFVEWLPTWINFSSESQGQLLYSHWPNVAHIWLWPSSPLNKECEQSLYSLKPIFVSYNKKKIPLQIQNKQTTKK